MSVLNSKPQINLKNHISSKNKGEGIRYCPKITVPNTLALSVGGGDGSRTAIKSVFLVHIVHIVQIIQQIFVKNRYILSIFSI